MTDQQNDHSKIIDGTNKLIDTKLDLLTSDLLSEDQLCELFEQLDTHEQYSNMIFIIAAYPRVMCSHYMKPNYNIMTKWNGTIDENNYFGASHDDMVYDLLCNYYVNYRPIDSSMGKFIHAKIFNNKTSSELRKMFEV